MNASRVVQRGDYETLAGVVDVSREAREQEFDEGKVLVRYVARQVCEMSIRNWPLDPGSWAWTTKSTNSEAMRLGSAVRKPSLARESKYAHAECFQARQRRKEKVKIES